MCESRYTPSTIYVISDLHLGGDLSDGKMCQQSLLLADFISAIANKDPDVDRSELVINGDFVDFLAERPVSDSSGWTPFHRNPDHACEVFRRVAEQREPEVFNALAQLVGRHHRLTIVLGNHDVELSLPAVRKELLQRIGAGRGRCVDVELVFDNEVYVVGDVVIEHGNRVDVMNEVDHDSLRRLRVMQSRLCATETFPPFDPAAGSVVVANFINETKRELPFVDLLKPAGRAMVPVLLALYPAVLPRLRRLVRPVTMGARSAGLRVVAPDRSAEIAAEVAPTEDPLIAAVRETLDEEDAAALLKAAGLVDRSGEIAARVSPVSLEVAFLLLRSLYRDGSFDVSREQGAPYRRAALEHVRSGFRTVIFGHTHHAVAEQITIDGRQGNYLNTGTWADLVRVPESIGDVLRDRDATAAELKDAKSELRVFLAAMKGNKLEAYLERRPTFARVELDGDTTRRALICRHIDGQDPATAEQFDGR